MAIDYRFETKNGYGWLMIKIEEGEPATADAEGELQHTMGRLHDYFDGRNLPIAPYNGNFEGRGQLYADYRLPENALTNDLKDEVKSCMEKAADDWPKVKAELAARKAAKKKK